MLAPHVPSITFSHDRNSWLAYSRIVWDWVPVTADEARLCVDHGYVVLDAI